MYFWNNEYIMSLIEENNQVRSWLKNTLLVFSRIWSRLIKYKNIKYLQEESAYQLNYPERKIENSFTGKMFYFRILFNLVEIKAHKFGFNDQKYFQQLYMWSGSYVQSQKTLEVIYNYWCYILGDHAYYVPRSVSHLQGALEPNHRGSGLQCTQDLHGDELQAFRRSHGFI